MNYTKAASSALIYPIEQITITIAPADLKTLNSSPVMLFPLGFNYCVIHTLLDYKCDNVNSGQEIWIGYETLLNGNISANQIRISTTTMATHIGKMSIAANNAVIWYANTINYQPLVLWQQTNDVVAQFDYFILTLTYLKFP